MNDYVFILIVLSILIIISMAWYYNPREWQSASFSKGEMVSVPIPAGKGLYSLRFKNCIFNVISDGKTLIKGDVSGVMNDVAKGYSKSSSEKYSISATDFTLPAPLNAFLFQFPENAPSIARNSAGVPIAPWCNPPTIISCSSDSDCNTNSLGSCVVVSSSVNNCKSISAPTVDTKATPPENYVCYTDPSTHISSWVLQNDPNLPRQCQLCTNDLTVTLDIQYRYI
jgi:hypothetical protein